MHQSLAGSSIYSSGRAPQRTTTTVSTPIVCMLLFYLGLHEHQVTIGISGYYTREV